MNKRVEWLRNKYVVNGKLWDTAFDDLVEIDPTPKKTYLQWLITLFLRDVMKVGVVYFRRKSTTITRQLKVFDTNKHLLPKDQRDINKISSLDELNSIEDRILAIRAAKNDKNIHKEIKTIYKGELGAIYTPLTERAAIYLGKGTAWCTAYTKSRNHFEDYDDDGPMYVIVSKVEGQPTRRWQFHAQSDEFKDVLNENADYNEVPEPLWKIVLDEVLGGSEQDILDLLHMNGYAIRWIPNPTEEMIFIALDDCGETIQFVDNPTEEMIRQAVLRNASALQFIDADRVSLDLIQQALYRNPTDTMNGLNNGSDLKDEIYTMFIKYNVGFFIRYHNKDARHQLLAIEANWEAIKAMEDPCEEAQIAAIKKNPFAHLHIMGITDKAKELAFKLISELED